ncbi:VOC family protein [candidate division KSB1 bacterium]|nr:VOC family protein [candidate division KSB1 bacterium]
MKYRNSVLFVKDVVRSKHFYADVLSQEIEDDFGRFVGFKGGFGIWDGSYALELIRGKPDNRASYGSENCELYFETSELDFIIQNLDEHGVPFVHPMKEHDWGQRGIRVEDPDGHIIEISEPMEEVVRRLHGEGMDLPAISKKTYFSLDDIHQILAE